MERLKHKVHSGQNNHLSALIITYNREHNIGLEDLNFVDEILVVDSLQYW
jgi:hypothetical protein